MPIASIPYGDRYCWRAKSLTAGALASALQAVLITV
jgi:hypothetical protein